MLFFLYCCCSDGLQTVLKTPLLRAGGNGVRCSVSGVRCQVFGVRCSVSGVRCQVFGVRCSVFGVRCSVFGVRCSVFGVRCQVFGVRCQVSGVQHPAPGTRNPAPGTRHPAPRTQNPEPRTNTAALRSAAMPNLLNNFSMSDCKSDTPADVRNFFPFLQKRNGRFCHCRFAREKFRILLFPAQLRFCAQRSGRRNHRFFP